MIELFPFQKEGSAFLQSKRYALLADEMGLGKTPQAIDACKALKKILIVCPSVAKYNWQKEFIKFDSRESFVAGEGMTYENKSVTICSFSYLVNHIGKYRSKKYDVVIVDEAHYLKEPKTHRTKAVLGSQGILHKTTRLWALTGTPAPNHAGELWVLLYTFGYTTLSYEGFIARYCNSHHVGDHYGRIQIVGSNTKHTPELKALLKKFSLRRLKRDVLNLPPMFHNTYYIEGDKSDVLKFRPDLKTKLADELTSLCERLNFNLDSVNDERLLAVLSLMSQSISSLRRYHGLTKVRPVAEMVRQELTAQEYKKIIIFGIHTDVLETLERSFLQDGFGIVIVTGKTPSIKRFEAQERFQTDDNIQIFIGNIQAAGINLTLTAASQVLFIEQDWVPGNNKQAADRTHRMGQREAVTVRHIAIRDSIDSKITATLTRKIQEISTFID